jgi:hypothetical protein
MVFQQIAVDQEISRIIITADLDLPRILALSSAEGPCLSGQRYRVAGSWWADTEDSDGPSEYGQRDSYLQG